MLQASNAARESGRIWLLAYLAFFVALSFAKAPGLFIDPRFWAEEGRDYFVWMRGLPLWEALIFTAKGSLQVILNAAIYLAAKVPLAYAPAVTTYTGFAIQLVAAGLIWLFVVENRIGHFAGLLLVAAWGLLVPTYETGASVTGAQFTCVVSVLIIALLPASAIERNLGKAAVWVLLCGFNGVPPCMLAPAFLARAVIERSRALAILGAILSACALLQFAIAVTSVYATRRFSLDPLALTLPFLVQTVLVPLIGITPVERLVAPIRDGTATPALVLAVYVASIALASLAVLLAARTGRIVIVAVATVAWVVLSLLNTFGAVGEPRGFIAAITGGRYYLFGAMCFCLLLALGTGAPQRTARWTAAALLALIAGVATAERVSAYWFTPFITGPSWKNGIAKCTGQPTCMLEVWPGGPNWTLTLRP